MMEILDVRKDNDYILKKLSEGATLKYILRHRHERDLSKDTLDNVYKKVYNNFFIQYKFVKFYWLTKSGWDEAIRICSESNISAQDCIHLATALEAGCDILVTSDKTFKKYSAEFIKTCLPEGVNKSLRELGFEI